MAKTSYLSIPAGLEELYFTGLKSGDRFVLPRIHPNTILLSQKKVVNLTSRSYFAQVKAAWHLLSDAEKAAWKSADQHVHKHGWRTFLADKCKRIKFGYAGNATPNSFHNDMVGMLQIDSPAEEIKLIQPHPQSYWVLHRVSGKKNMYEPSLVTEVFYLPLTISINYKADLTSTGAGSFARLFARVRHLYQGENLDYDLIAGASLSHEWETITANIDSLLGQAISYNLYLHLYKVRGTFYFDNVKATHGGTNWARDNFCKHIDQSFTKAFYQIPAHWAAVTVPDGAGFESIYPI
jgi:hypothetical protein